MERVLQHAQVECILLEVFAISVHFLVKIALMHIHAHLALKITCLLEAVNVFLAQIALLDSILIQVAQDAIVSVELDYIISSIILAAIIHVDYKPLKGQICNAISIVHQAFSQTKAYIV